MHPKHAQYAKWHNKSITQTNVYNPERPYTHCVIYTYTLWVAIGDEFQYNMDYILNSLEICVYIRFGTIIIIRVYSI